MENKALKRIFKKNFEISTDDDLVGLISQLKNQSKLPDISSSLGIFFENFEAAIEVLDRTLTDYERTLEISHRSISISSKEMTILNDEIHRHASQQEAILSRLQSTIEILNPNRSAPSVQNNQSLENLIETVNQLVLAQLDSVKWQKTLFAEGIKICSVLNFKHLEKQIRLSVENVTNLKLNLRVFFSGHLFESKDTIEFYQCDEQNRPIEETKLSSLTDSANTKFINVDSPKGNGTLAIVQILNEANESATKMDSHIARISPLVPSISSTLENIKLLKDEKRQQYIEAELNTARLVQQTLLPKIAQGAAIKDIEVNAFYQSATECGGDWWSYFRTADGTPIVLVGDVTGHGTGSAMLCAVVKGYCDSFLNRHNISVSQILKELNSVVYTMAQQTNRMMTMVAFAMDPRTGESTISSAGHPMPLYFQSLSQNTLGKVLSASGPILGSSLESEFKEIKFQFNQGDMIIFYTDGLTECNNRQGMMYGDNRLERLLRNLNKISSPSALNTAMIEDIQQFAVGEPFADDITTVVIRRLPV